jgi:hypothetical protein
MNPIFPDFPNIVAVKDWTGVRYGCSVCREEWVFREMYFKDADIIISIKKLHRIFAKHQHDIDDRGGIGEGAL